jgi:hypothetical protein
MIEQPCLGKMLPHCGLMASLLTLASWKLWFTKESGEVGGYLHYNSNRMCVRGRPLARRQNIADVTSLSAVARAAWAETKVTSLERESSCSKANIFGLLDKNMCVLCVREGRKKMPAFIAQTHGKMNRSDTNVSRTQARV